MIADGPPLRIREIGSFYVGGEMVHLEGLPTWERVSTPRGPVHPIDPNDEIMAGQMYVQYVRLAEHQSSAPLLMWQGGGMTGVYWETTPDGRPGWQRFFLRAGFDTYVSDAVERGRASWAPFPQVYPEAPYFRTAKEMCEEVFRFGPIGSWAPDPAKRRTHPGLRFPSAYFETYQSVPGWGCNDAATQRAYDALLQRFDDGVVILTHSQGGNFGMTAALHAPERVRAVISLEPSGAPDPAQQDACLLKDIPHLFVWGDYLDQHSFWQESLARLGKVARRAAAGGLRRHLDRPARARCPRQQPCAHGRR